MNARAVIVAAVDAALPSDVDVLPYARTIDAPLRSTVMVRIDTVKPSQWAGALAWTVEAALVLIGAQTTDPAAVEDELDNLLADVLVALVDVEGLRWTEAKRAGYPEQNPTNPAYEVAVTIHTTEES